MGYFRFSMMLAVVYYHLVFYTLSGYIAVHGFFALSGYVITKVCHETYNHGWRGKKYFLINRCLRLYPVYLSCLVISFLCMWVTGFTTQYLHEFYRLPEDIWGWLVQFTILGQSNFTPERTPARLLPAAWSLSSEVFYYLIIGLITGASKRLTTIAFGLAVLLAGVMYAQGDTFKYYYLTLYGPAYIFFTGAMAYYYGDKLTFLKNRPLWLCVLLLNLMVYVPEYMTWPSDHPSMPLFFTCTMLLFFFIPAFECVRMPGQPARWLNQWLADLTYPVFLIHWAMDVIIRAKIYHTYRYTEQAMPVFLLSLLASLALGVVLVRYIERPAQRLRARMRVKAY